MSTLLHRDPRNAVPGLLEWLESPFMTLRPYLAQPIRVEDYVPTAATWCALSCRASTRRRMSK